MKAGQPEEVDEVSSDEEGVEDEMGESASAPSGKGSTSSIISTLTFQFPQTSPQASLSEDHDDANNNGDVIKENGSKF